MYIHPFYKSSELVKARKQNSQSGGRFRALATSTMFTTTVFIPFPLPSTWKADQVKISSISSTPNGQMHHPLRPISVKHFHLGKWSELTEHTCQFTGFTQKYIWDDITPVSTQQLLLPASRSGFQKGKLEEMPLFQSGFHNFNPAVLDKAGEICPASRIFLICIYKRGTEVAGIFYIIISNYKVYDKCNRYYWIDLIHR